MRPSRLSNHQKELIANKLPEIRMYLRKMGKTSRQINDLIYYLPQVTMEIDIEKGGGLEKFSKHAAIRCTLREIDALRKENRAGLFNQQKRMVIKKLKEEIENDSDLKGVEEFDKMLSPLNPNEQRINIGNVENFANISIEGPNPFAEMEIGDLMNGLVREADDVFSSVFGKNERRKNKIRAARRKLVKEYVVPKVMMADRVSLKKIADDTNLSLSYVLKLLRDKTMKSFFSKFLEKNGIGGIK